jgi:PAS domain-containing protein
LLFGFHKQEVIGKSTDELNLYANGNERAELIKHISDHGRIVNHENLMRRKTGEIVNILYPADLLIRQGNHFSR